MKDAVGSVESVRDGGALADIRLDQLGRRMQILAPSGREIIDQADSKSKLDQSIDQMRSDKSGAAGHDYETPVRRRLRDCIAHDMQFYLQAARTCDSTAAGLFRRSVASRLVLVAPYKLDQFDGR